ncbi:MAG: (d)CMP kinase [Deltaproteobacteria bacterium]|nr:MAG: (d)CMP kinase [Deltaproteobacteria bacterium]
MKKLIIAIDGPSGVGKSTLSKVLSHELGYLNLDTGAMYRTVALAASRRGIDAHDHDALRQLCEETTIEFSRNQGDEQILLNGEDVSSEIRTPEISLLTATVAACPDVREAMVAQQRALGAAGGVVLEGRDIGTVVFPHADVKFFLKASAEVRGRRRFLELQAKGAGVDLARTITEVQARDTADTTRATSPLRQAEDAVVIDTTELDIPQVLERMFTIVADCQGSGEEL